MLRMTPVALALTAAALPPLAWSQAAPVDQPAAEKTLPLVKATASATRAPAELPRVHAGGQVAQGARLGLLGNESVMDLPFNVTAFTAQLIEDQQARTLADVLVNDPSVRFTTSSGHLYENFRVRGFDVNASELAIDGLFGLAPVGHAAMEFVERVELLKGPSALFSGMPPGGGVGGVVNLVPKRAGKDPLTRVTLGLQSDAQLGASLDLGRRFGELQQWGLRVNLAHGDGDTTLDGQSKRRLFGSAALDYRGDALTASVDAYHSQTKYEGGTPAMYWFQSSTPIPDALDPRTNLFPGTQGELESRALIARGEYEFGPRLAAFAALGAMNFDSQGFINGTHARNIAANGNFTAATNSTRAFTDSAAGELGLRARFAGAGMKHELVVQATQLTQDSGSTTASASASSNIYKPVTTLVMPALPAHAPRTSRSTLSSLALVDTLSLAGDRLRLTLGLREQRVETTSYSASTGAQTARYDKRALTPALAAVLKPWGPSLSLYANYVQGLSKGDTVSDTAATNYQQVFAPYKTEQMEIGAKWATGGFTNTAALFQITKPMLVALGTSSSPTYSDEGEKRMRGLEWNTFGELTRTVRLLGGASYTRGVQTKTAYDANNGKDAIAAPRWQGNLGAEWDAPLLQGLTLSGRVNVTSAQYLDAANRQQVPGWHTLDVGARYATRFDGHPLVLRLNVSNLLDRHYWSGSFSDNYAMATLGAPRSVSASASLDF